MSKLWMSLTIPAMTAAGLACCAGSLRASPPQLRRAVATGPFCAVVSWERVDLQDFDRLEVHAGATADFAPGDSTLVATSRSPVDTSLGAGGFAPSTRYFVRLRAVDRSGQESLSKESLAIETPAGPHPDYHFVGAFGERGSTPGRFMGPMDLAVDQDRNVWITDFRNNRVQKFTPSGYGFVQWGSTGTAGGQFQGPAGIALDGRGSVWVTDTRNARVQRFTTEGRFQQSVGAAGAGEGQFRLPRGVTVDDQGYVYVTDSGNRNVQKFNPTGGYLLRFQPPGKGSENYMPVGICADPAGFVYVTDARAHCVHVFNNEGRWSRSFGTPGCGPGEFSAPCGVTLDPIGNLYVADSGNNRIQKFNRQGRFLGQWGNRGKEWGAFLSPQGLAVHQSGTVYVADVENDRVQTFLPTLPDSASTSR